MNILNLLLTIFGILVSGFGLYYAIMQVKGLQRITKQYQEQVKQEVSTAQHKIRDGLLISEVTLCLKNLESAIKYIRKAKLNWQCSVWKILRLRFTIVLYPRTI